MSEPVALDYESPSPEKQIAPVPNLGRRAARGGAIVLASTLANRTLSLGFTVILSRILTPVEYGELGMVLTLTMIIGVFNDMGLTSATIQKADLQHHEASVVFWLNLLVGCILFAVTTSLAPALAMFYHVTELRKLTTLCAMAFPITALGAQHIATMVRRFEFHRVAACDITGVVTGGIVGVLMAAAGMGVLALAGQIVGSAAASTTMAWLLSKWKPSLPQRYTNVRGILRFGGYLTGFNIVNYLSRNFDNVLVGRVCGSEILGLYTRAYTLMMYPIGLVSSPLARVALPTLSQFQKDHARMRSAYLRILNIIGFITFPMMTLLLASAHDVIAVLYGRKWMDTVPLFQILCIAGIYQGIYSAAGQVLTASGRTDRMMRLGMGVASILCVAFFIGIQWGAKGVAIAYVIGSGLTLIPYLSYVYSTIDLKVSDALAPLVPTMAAAIGAGLVSMLLQAIVGEHVPPIVRLMFTGVLGGLAYLGILWTFWRGQLHQLFGQARHYLIPKSWKGHVEH